MSKGKRTRNRAVRVAECLSNVFSSRVGSHFRRLVRFSFTASICLNKGLVKLENARLGIELLQLTLNRKLSSHCFQPFLSCFGPERDKCISFAEKQKKLRAAETYSKY